MEITIGLVSLILLLILLKMMDINTELNNRNTLQSETNKILNEIKNKLK